MDSLPSWLYTFQWLVESLMRFMLFFSTWRGSARGSVFGADTSQWLQKPLNVTTLTAVRGHSSNDEVREKVGKMRRTGGDANLLRKGAHKLMKHFLDDYPQVQLLLIGHSDISQFSLLRSHGSVLYWTSQRVCFFIFWLHRKKQLYIWKEVY